MAKELICHILDNAITKYRHKVEVDTILSENAPLILGQVNGDQAIEKTECLYRTNFALLSGILENSIFPEEFKYFYKAHPKNADNHWEIQKIRQTYPSIVILDENQNLMELLRQKPTLATITSGAGLEAALRGCTVHCFGVSFYSHWGFTIDHLPCTRRTNKLSAEDVAAEIYINQSVYIDPVSKVVTPISDVYGLKA